MKNQSTMKVTIITPDYVAFEGEASFWLCELAMVI